MARRPRDTNAAQTKNTDRSVAQWTAYQACHWKKARRPNTHESEYIIILIPFNHIDSHHRDRPRSHMGHGFRAATETHDDVVLGLLHWLVSSSCKSYTTRRKDEFFSFYQNGWWLVSCLSDSDRLSWSDLGTMAFRHFRETGARILNEYSSHKSQSHGFYVCVNQAFEQVSKTFQRIAPQANFLAGLRDWRG